jgi:2,3-bisphosphoglycerate-independent phosphoglycerate mutase
MKTKDGKPITSHSTNEVPLILITEKKYDLKKHGSLPDISPTLLDLMDIKIPEEMTGKSLLIKR